MLPQVVEQLKIAHIIVNLDSDPKCGIICPLQTCNQVSKLSLVKQVDFSAPPKFNTFNFERHFKTQHVNKKRRALENITNVRDMYDFGDDDPNVSIEFFSTEKVFIERNQSVTSTPKQKGLARSITSTIQTSGLSCQSHTDDKQEQIKYPNAEHEIQLEEYRLKIHELTEDNSQKKKDFELLQEQQQQQLAEMLRWQCEVSKRDEELRALENKNAVLLQQQISLRHKIMDTRGTIRAICRLKLENDQPGFEWNVSDDKNHLKFSKQSKIII